MAEKGKDKEDDAVAAAPPTLKELCNALYSSCSLHDSDKLFFQEDLLGLNIIPKGDDELQTLTKCIEKLLAQKLFKTHSKNSQVCWKVTKREDAAK
jgi:DNA-directed RNA polymerase III subunit RPC6